MERAQKLVLSAGSIASAVGGRLVAGDGERTIDGFSIDTRTLAPGDLFFAIRGERLDGHAFVADAIRRGACGAIISDRAAISSAEDRGSSGVFILVGDTIEALQTLGRYVRRASGAAVVAVTGSAGKSTTKEITAELLSARYRVFRNRGNLNNHIGLPLSLLELRAGPEVAVVEFGMSHAGEIHTLVGLAEPQVRVWTNVGPTHLEFFTTVDAVADAKAEIFDGAGATNVLVANADDERVMARTPRFSGRVVTFGITHAADVRASDLSDHGIDGMLATIRTPRGAAQVRTPLLGQGNLANLLAATAVADHFEVPLTDVVERAANLRAVPHRGEVVRLAGGIALIDDSYNSNPAALAGALAILCGEQRFTRRVGVLGEMLEIGGRTEALHATCGREAAASGLNLLVAVGGAPARALAHAAVVAGMPATAVSCVATSDEAADLAASLIKRGDLVLIKGSRGVHTEIVVDRLKAEFA